MLNTHFTLPWPFCPVQKITYQHDSNYSSAHIISMVSKLFLSVNYTFHSIYSNINPSSEDNLPNNLFKHNSLLICIFYTCQPIIYTYKTSDLYKKKKWEKGVTSIVSSKVMRITVVNLKLSTLQVMDIVDVTPFFQFFCVKQWFTGVNH